MTSCKHKSQINILVDQASSGMDGNNTLLYRFSEVVQLILYLKEYSLNICIRVILTKKAIYSFCSSAENSLIIVFSLALLIGFDKNPFIPASKHSLILLSSANAVNATIG